MAEYETLKIKFDGGIASRGHIHLYEYSRSQYAFSRFVTIVEQYRRSGQIIDRVTPSKTIDMIVSAPEKGSFSLGVLVPLVAPVIDQVAKISFETLFSFVWSKLLPHSSDRDELAVKLAENELARERERTVQLVAQQHGETERLQIVSQIVAQGRANTKDLMDLLGRAIDQPNPRNISSGYMLEDLAKEREMLLADMFREDFLNENAEKYQHIDSRGIDSLVRKVRPLVNDIGLPLRRSADRCSIGSADNDNQYVRLDISRLQQINTRDLDEEEFELTCLLRSYDRFSGRGRVEFSNDEKPLSFVVDPSDKEDMRSKILTAMDMGYVRIICAAYRDAAGEITSLILRDILL